MTFCFSLSYLRTSSQVPRTCCKALAVFVTSAAQFLFFLDPVLEEGFLVLILSFFCFAFGLMDFQCLSDFLFEVVHHSQLGVKSNGIVYFCS